MKPIDPPICPYCTKPAMFFASSARFYHDTDFGPVWACLPCQAWVGCHKTSARHVPLGRLADAELRRAKQEAHRFFDPLWKGKIRRDGCSKGEARQAGYKWLADQMGIAIPACHIGHFDVEQCRRVVALCAAIGKKEAA